MASYGRRSSARSGHKPHLLQLILKHLVGGLFCFFQVKMVMSIDDIEKVIGLESIEFLNRFDRNKGS